ncbi:hypothetical protein MNV49_005067 [Pseudohyphozyma bogoriensis]|nr:hypothetical protein MNV49_005067 [Pseudohyphozyma bogoriensis]
MFLMIFYGVLLAVVVDYVRSELYKRDKLRERVALWTCVVLTTLMVSMDMHVNVWYATKQDRSFGSLLRGPVTSTVGPLVEALNAAIVQIYFIHRCGTLIRKPWRRRTFFAMMGLLVMGALACGTVLSVIRLMTWRGNRSQRLLQLSPNFSAAWLWLTAVIDILISVSLLWTLWGHISGFNRATDSVLKKIILLGAQTASYTSVLAIVAVKTSSPFWIPMAPLYALAYLTTLSARPLLRRELHPSNPPLGGLSGLEASVHVDVRTWDAGLGIEMESRGMEGETKSAEEFMKEVVQSWN